MATGDTNEGKVWIEFAITRKTSQSKSVREADKRHEYKSKFISEFQSHTKKAVYQIFNSNTKNRAKNKIENFFFSW